MGDWADDCEREADFREEEALEFLKKVNEAQAAVIEAAEALFNGYTAEDSRQDYWKIDAVLDHRLYALFLKIEALQEVEGE